MNLSKTYEDELLGIILVVKSSKSKHNKISIQQNGGVRVSVPKWQSFTNGYKFALKNADWIIKHQPSKRIFENGSRIGRNHKLVFVKSTSKIDKDKIYIDTRSGEDSALNDINRLCVEALRVETNELIKPRMNYWKKEMNLKPNSISVRHTTSRWGSCSPKKNISISVFTAQLHDELVDYIIVHELAHLKQLNHSNRYWKIVEQYIPYYKELRKELKRHRLTIVPK